MNADPKPPGLGGVPPTPRLAWVRRGRARYVARMGPLVGDQAAAWLHSAACWQLLAYPAVLVWFGCIVLAQIASTWFWAPAVVAAAAIVIFFVRANRSASTGCRIARDFLTAKHGVPFPMPPKNTSPAPWRFFIARVTEEGTAGV